MADQIIPDVDLVPADDPRVQAAWESFGETQDALPGELRAIRRMLAAADAVDPRRVPAVGWPFACDCGVNDWRSVGHPPVRHICRACAAVYPGQEP